MKSRGPASPKDANDADGGVRVDPSHEVLEEPLTTTTRGRTLATPISASSSTRSRRSTNGNWRTLKTGNGSADSPPVSPAETADAKNREQNSTSPSTASTSRNRATLRGPWAITHLIILVSALGITLLATLLHSVTTRQLDPKGCRMSFMRPSYITFKDFDTEHTRFATKYSLHLYREQTVNDEKLRGVPVLFVPGNAGSYKQVRPIAAEASNYFDEVLKNDEAAIAGGVRNLDFFTVDFNEDITAFHGQTLLDQAEYLNEAVRYILSLYLDPQRSPRLSNLPDPTSVIVVGHSMGGVVARTMLTMPNYQANSINTIITMSAPHSQAPVTFDGQIVEIYDNINAYWRNAYAQEWANTNPLWHVTLVSIAGGGLDTVVPSDYASVESVVPQTHGFTVFTTGIPTVWTSMDHQAILWCDQFRKVVTRTLYDVVDARRPSQTKPRVERMKVFRKWLLTGMETDRETSLPDQRPSTLLVLGDDAHEVVHNRKRLLLRQLGGERKRTAYLLPIPPPDTPQGSQFTLLTDSSLAQPGDTKGVEVLLCSIFTSQPGQSASSFSNTIDLSTDRNRSTQLGCKSAASDVVLLPRSTTWSTHPFSLDRNQKATPFSYLQYHVQDLSDHQFVVVLDNSAKPSSGFLVAEFVDDATSIRTQDVTLPQLFGLGTSVLLPADRPTVTHLRIPSIESSLLAYHLEVEPQRCDQNRELFAPLLRQYMNKPYESKFFVNARNAEISIHGVSPFVPTPVKPSDDEKGLGFQFWIDPTCQSQVTIRLRIDVLGSLGKLYMRYRTVFAAFPLLIVTLVLGKQFQVYDQTGTFVSFAEGLDLCFRSSYPTMLLCFTMLSVSGWRGWNAPGARSGQPSNPELLYHRNDSLTGTTDPFFWFLVPLIGVISAGVCVGVHYLALLLTQTVGLFFHVFRRAIPREEKRRAASPAALVSPASPRRRMVTTGILLMLVSTFLPYQFAYLVACLIQLVTTIRALQAVFTHGHVADYNFYNYTHSVFLLMLWVLPINLPILAVWLRNLAVQWFTPFSSHHNVMSIISFILLVENMTTGKMIPRVTNRSRHVTTALFIGTAFYAGVYGISHAYQLHHLTHLIATWLVLIYLTSGSWSLAGLMAVFQDVGMDGRKRGKTP